LALFQAGRPLKSMKGKYRPLSTVSKKVFPTLDDLEGRIVLNTGNRTLTSARSKFPIKGHTVLNLSKAYLGACQRVGKE
jgi:hypothetical protein